MDGRQYFVLVGKDERLRDRNKLLRGNDQLNVQIHSQLFPIFLFLCTFLCSHGLFMFRRKIQLRTYFLYCAVSTIFINSDVEQQKRRHLAVFSISFLWQRGTCPEKRKDYYLNKKPSRGILHRSNLNRLQYWSVVMTSSELKFRSVY